MYVCGYREIHNIDNKYYNDLVWFIWEILLKEGSKINNDFLNKQIQSLYKLYKYDFKQGSKSKKNFYFLVAVKYFTDNYHINENINNYHLLVQSTLNINKLFFEKNKLSKNNAISKQIKKFNKNVSQLNKELEIKDQKLNDNLKKNKLLELQKIADTKMKLKINTVEEIDSLILNKYL